MAIVFYKDNKVYGASKFDRDKWLAAKKELKNSDSSRCGMYKDLEKNYLKKGMTRQEVENLLGKVTTYFYCLDKKVKCASYGMGTCVWNSLTSSGPVSVEICFNDKEKVVAFSRDTHIVKNFCEDQKNRALCFSDKEYCICYKEKLDEYGNNDNCKIDRW